MLQLVRNNRSRRTKCDKLIFFENYRNYIYLYEENSDFLEELQTSKLKNVEYTYNQGAQNF